VHATSSFDYHGYELVYDTYGTKGPLVVYLHGLLLDADLNRGIAEALAARGHRVVLLDLLGHGRSGAPTHASAYRIDSYADQVFALLDELGEERAVLGGMSLGANVSLFAASRHPERVTALVLEMPVLEWAVPSAALVFSPMLLLAHYARRPLRWVGHQLRRLPATPFPPLNSVLHAGATPPEVISAVLHGVLVGPVAPTVEDRRSITAPTLVLCHRYDLIHPFDDAENLARQLPNATLVRAHSPLELRLRPGRLTEEIGSFVDDVAVDPARARGKGRAAG
jgi:pimeloyl-ACP methyl ester carboxylesterase